MPPLTAIARYPSSLISHTHPGASGSFATARHSIGSMKAGSRVGSERSRTLAGSGHRDSVRAERRFSVQERQRKHLKSEPANAVSRVRWSDFDVSIHLQPPLLRLALLKQLPFSGGLLFSSSL